MLRLRLDEFIAWLTSKDPDDIVGYSRTGDSCPLARFLEEKTGQPAFVGESVIVVGDDTYSAPSWVTKFVRAVDRLYYCDAGVSAGDALRIANSLKPRLYDLWLWFKAKLRWLLGRR